MALLMMGPWMIKNALFVNNALSPFANQLFPNPYVSVWLQENLARYFHERITPLEIPWEVIMDGGRLTGVFGRVFLLTTLLLLRLGRRSGPQLAPAALHFALPICASPRTRVLCPSRIYFTAARPHEL